MKMLLNLSKTNSFANFCLIYTLFWTAVVFVVIFRENIKKILYQIVKELFAAAFGGFVQLLVIPQFI